MRQQALGKQLGVWCWLGLVLAAQPSHLAFAQESAASPQDDSDSARAEELFRLGRKASARGDHQAACESYRESFRLESALGTLLNIAVCEEALGELASAWEHYQRVLPALPEGDSRLALTRDRLEALDRRLPRVTVLLMAGDRDTTRIAIGAVEHAVSSLGGPLRVDPGQHELRVLAAGHEPRSYPFQIGEGEQRTLAVEPGVLLAPPPAAEGVATPAQAASSAPPPPRDDSGRLQRTFGWAALAVGGAGLAASAVAFGLVIDRKLTVDDHCPDRECDAVGDDAAKSGRTFTYVSLISLAGGALATAGGLYLLWTAPSDGGSVSAAPIVDRNLLGAQVLGTF